MVTWVKGQHTLKFGGEYREIKATSTTPATSRVVSTFDPPADRSSDRGGQRQRDGQLPARRRQQWKRQPDHSVRGRYIRQKAYIWHVGDTWKVSQKLSLNFGLRWDHFTPSEEKYNNMCFFDFGPNPGAGGRPGRLAFCGNKYGAASAGVRYPENDFHGG